MAWHKDSPCTRGGFTHCNMSRWCYSSTHWRRYWTYTRATCTVWWWFCGGGGGGGGGLKWRDMYKDSKPMVGKYKYGCVCYLRTSLQDVLLCAWHLRSCCIQPQCEPMLALKPFALCFHCARMSSHGEQSGFAE